MYIYRTTYFSTHIHNINHNISIYLIKVTLSNQIHNCLGEKDTNLWYYQVYNKKPSIIYHIVSVQIITLK